MKIKFTHVEEGKQFAKFLAKLGNLFLGVFTISGILISIYSGHANDIVSPITSGILITKFTFFLMCGFIYVWTGDYLHEK